MLSNILHRLAHWIDPSPCRCAVSAYMRGWNVSRDNYTSKKAVPANPDAERAFRERLADSERGAA